MRLRTQSKPKTKRSSRQGMSWLKEKKREEGRARKNQCQECRGWARRKQESFLFEQRRALSTSPAHHTPEEWRANFLLRMEVEPQGRLLLLKIKSHCMLGQQEDWSPRTQSSPRFVPNLYMTCSSKVLGGIKGSFVIIYFSFRKTRGCFWKPCLPLLSDRSL